MTVRETAAVRLLHVTTAPVTLRFLIGQPRYMRERGFEVFAVSSPGTALNAFETTQQVPVHAISMARRITPWRDVVAIARLYRHFRRVRPHIVHSHTPKAGLLGTIAAKLARVPVSIYHVHGLPSMTATGSRRALLRLSDYVACALADRVLCVSRSVRDIVVAERLCRDAKIVVRGPGSINGVDAAERFNPSRWTSMRSGMRRQHGIPANAVVVGFVGRIAHDKGIADLVNAWKRLRREADDLHLLFVGPFESHDPVPADVDAELRADCRIHLAGEQLDLPPFYAAMDLVVLPSYREGFPVVPLEAAAMSLPVVATDIPGCREAVRDGVTGRLVPPRDVTALADAIAAYVRDPHLRRTDGRAARRRVLREFRPEAVCGATYDEYVRLLRQSEVSAGSAAASVLSPDLK